MLCIPVFHSDTENKGKYRQRARAVLFSVCGRQGSLTELPKAELFTSAGQRKDLQWSSNAISNSVVPPKEHWRGVADLVQVPALLSNKDLDIVEPQIPHL